MTMNCFCGMVDRRKAFSLISSRGHCQRSSPSQISDTPRVGFESAQNLSSDFVEGSCAVVITTTPRRHKTTTPRRHKVFLIWRQTALGLKQSRKVMFCSQVIQVFIFLTISWFTKSLMLWYVLVHETACIFEYFFWATTP